MVLWLFFVRTRPYNHLHTLHMYALNSFLQVDPRIHFALNCGAKSCPPVKVYSSEGLNSELKAAAASFVADNVSVPDETGTVKCGRGRRRKRGLCSQYAANREEK